MNHIAKRINGFVSKDPNRVIDMWSAKKADRIHQICIRHLNMPKQRVRILDAGCGKGDLIYNLKTCGYKSFDYTGFDCSSEAIEVCKQKWQGGNFHVAEDCLPLFRDEPQFDYGFILGPLAYTQGNHKMDCLKLVTTMRYMCTHGVGYFMYTEAKDSAPGPVFTRFNPKEIAEVLPDCRVIIDDEMISEYKSGASYEDFDKGIILW